MKIFINTTINAPLENVWKAWINPKDITQWNFASEEWHCPKANIDLKLKGSFSYRMEAKDGSMGFDFTGVFTKIETHKAIEYSLEDGRKVNTTFDETEHGVEVEQSFDAEDEHSAQLQKQGWQSILNNFKQHLERNNE